MPSVQHLIPFIRQFSNVMFLNRQSQLFLPTNPLVWCLAIAEALSGFSDFFLTISSTPATGNLTLGLSRLSTHYKRQS